MVVLLLIQVLFIRMSVTMVASLVYMWWAKVPHAPFGAKSVRYLLLARGFGGFFGGEYLHCRAKPLLIYDSIWSLLYDLYPFIVHTQLMQQTPSSTSPSPKPPLSPSLHPCLPPGSVPY